MHSDQQYSRFDGNRGGNGGDGESRTGQGKPAVQMNIVRSVRLRPQLAAGVAAVVFAMVVLFALTRKPMYQAQSLTYVEPLASKLVSDGSEGTYDGSRYDSYLQQQIQTAQRPDILIHAIEKLPAGTWQLPGETLQSAAERLANSLKVARVGTSYQLSMTLQGGNPENVAAVVNAATNAYLEQGRKDEHARSDGRMQLLTEESERIQAELQQDRTEQAALSSTLGVADATSGTANPYDMTLAGLRTELTSARAAHDVAAAQLASVSGTAQSSGLKAVAEDVIANDSGLGSFKASVNQRRASLSSQMSGLTPSNPVYKQYQDEIAQLDREVEARTTLLRKSAETRVQEKLRVDLQRTGDVEARLNGQLAHAVAAATGAAPKLQRASELAADVTRLQARYAAVDDALRGLQLETNGPGTAHLSVAATVPTAPEASKRGLLLVLALPLGLFAGIAAAVFAKRRDPLVYSSADVEYQIGVAPLAIMPSAFEVSDAVAEEYLLRLATGLERAYRTNLARSFVFTAASLDSQISDFVESVQKKLVELGFKAIVVEPSQIWRVDAAQRHARDGYAVTRLEQLKKENNFVLIDAQPLLHSADSEYVASTADATFLVIESGLTTGEELKQSMVVLRKLRARGVGTVLQNMEAKYGDEKLRMPIEVVERKRIAADEWEPQELVAASDAELVKERREKTRDVIRLEEVIGSMHELLRNAKEESYHSAAGIEDAPAMTEMKPVVEVDLSVTQIVDPVATVPVVEAKAKETMVVRFAEMPVVVENDLAAESHSAVQFVEDAVNAPLVEEVKTVFAEPIAVAAPESVPMVARVATVATVASDNVESVPAPRMIAWGANIKSGSRPGVKVESKRTSREVAQAVAAAMTETATETSVAPAVEQVVLETPAPRLPVFASVPVAAMKGDSVTIEAVVAAPIVPWAPRPERRRTPRIAEAPRASGKAINARHESRGSMWHGSTRQSAAEHSAARVSGSSTRVPVAAAVEQPEATIAVSARRWGLLSRLDAQFESNRATMDEAAS